MRLSRGELAIFAGVVFFATLAVLLLSTTLRPPIGFVAGMGWLWVLQHALAWAEAVDG